MDQLTNKIGRIIRRGTVSDRPRAGRPRTVATRKVCNRIVRQWIINQMTSDLYAKQQKH